MALKCRRPNPVAVGRNIYLHGSCRACLITRLGCIRARAAEACRLVYLLRKVLASGKGLRLDAGLYDPGTNLCSDIFACFTTADCRPVYLLRKVLASGKGFRLDAGLYDPGTKSVSRVKNDAADQV